jgi:hypothetical protein
LLPLRAVNAKEETTRLQKINGQHQTSWNSTSIVDFAGRTLYIKRLNKRIIVKILCRPVALTVERRTPNPGVGGSNPSWPANF